MILPDLISAYNGVFGLPLYLRIPRDWLLVVSLANDVGIQCQHAGPQIMG